MISKTVKMAAPIEALTSKQVSAWKLVILDFYVIKNLVQSQSTFRLFEQLYDTRYLFFAY